MIKSRVLVIDADQQTKKLLQLYMPAEGFEMVACVNFSTAMSKLEEYKPDIILSELILEDIDGFEMIRTICNKFKCPLIIVTSRNELFDKVISLELGCDDYVVKPFEPKEVIARMRACIRRCQKSKLAAADESDQAEGTLQYDNLVVDKLEYKVTINNKHVDLPPKEFELLYFLFENRDKLFSRKQILEKVWRTEFMGDSRTIDVHIKRLREKLDVHHHPNWSIKTVWGVGYKFQTVKSQ